MRSTRDLRRGLLLALLTGACGGRAAGGLPLAASCGVDSECASGICATTITGGGVCTGECEDDSGCPTGWTCDLLAGRGLCECVPVAEACDGEDDDCDGRTDEGACQCDPGAAETCNAVDDDCDTRIDEETAGALCEAGLECVSGRCESCLANVDEIDLLLAIDNSNSMLEEQASLVAELPRLISVLASGDLDQDGTQDFDPVRSLHVGVITSDMGSGGLATPSCGEPMFGDDGVLRTAGSTERAGCMAAYPSVFEYAPASGRSPADFASDVACVATIGTGGCGFEQQLEAVLKSISPAAPTEWTAPDYVPPTFYGATSGHGDGANEGFIRPRSVLAVLVLTDEEDCSVADPSIFDRMDPRYAGVNLNLRCFVFRDAQHPIDRYVRGLAALRPAGRLVLGVIAGIPLDLVADPSSADFDAILADPRMQETPDPSTSPPSRLLTSCDVPDRGIAFPPRRIVAVARDLDALGARTAIGSICQDSYRAVTDSLVAQAMDAARQVCP